MQLSKSDQTFFIRNIDLLCHLTRRNTGNGKKKRKKTSLNYILHFALNKTRFSRKNWKSLFILFTTHSWWLQNEWITFWCLINRWEETVVRSLYKTNWWNRCARTSRNFEKPTKKQQYGSKVNYLNIYLVEYGFTIWVNLETK